MIKANVGAARKHMKGQRFIKGKGVGPLCPSVANCLSFLV